MNNQTRTGLVIGTFAAVPYIHLHLESRKRYYPHLPVLIHDDCSPKKEDLKQLAAEYGAEFISTDNRNFSTLGDISVFVNGLKWAEEKELEFLVKMSRRFIPRTDWTNSFSKLTETGHHTFSNITRSYNFGFRTECLGMRLMDWNTVRALGKMEQLLAEKQDVFVEGYLHNIARELNYFNDAAHNWDVANNRSVNANGYAVWDFMKEDRCKPADDFLWHNANAPEEYYQLANRFGLPYSVADFTDPNAGV